MLISYSVQEIIKNEYDDFYKYSSRMMEVFKRRSDFQN